MPGSFNVRDGLPLNENRDLNENREPQLPIAPASLLCPGTARAPGDVWAKGSHTVRAASSLRGRRPVFVPERCDDTRSLIRRISEVVGRCLRHRDRWACDFLGGRDIDQRSLALHIPSGGGGVATSPPQGEPVALG